MRNARILGLALLAMFSMSAVMAVSAQADTLTAGVYPADLTGEKEAGFTDEFKTTTGIVKCTSAKYDATITGPVTTAGSVSATPTYSGCTGFGFPATVDHNGCTYQFKVLAGTAGTVSLVCPAGNEITITANPHVTLKCTVHVPPQTDIAGAITYANIAGGITLSVNLSGIKYTHTDLLATGVGKCLPGAGANGTLVAKAIITADEDTGGKTGPTSLLLS